MKSSLLKIIWFSDLFFKQKCGLVMFLAASQTLEGGLCCKTWACMGRWESLNAAVSKSRTSWQTSLFGSTFLIFPEKSLLLNYSVKSVVGNLLWQSLISLFWSHMTKILIQAKNQIKVVRLNLQIYHLKWLKSHHLKLLNSSLTSVVSKELLTKE